MAKVLPNGLMKALPNIPDRLPESGSRESEAQQHASIYFSIYDFLCHMIPQKCAATHAHISMMCNLEDTWKPSPKALAISRVPYKSQHRFPEN